jgi:uncharacterized protein (TIGR03067 family)
MRLTICVLLGIAFPLAVVVADPPTDAKAIRGTWEFESIKLDGKALTPEQAKQMGPGIVIAPATISSSDPAHRDVKNLYKIDASKNPKWITMDKTLIGMNKDSSGKDVKRTIVQKQIGIYKLDGDQLTICWSTKNTAPKFDRTGRLIDTGTSKERPASFDGDLGTILFVFKRVAK